MTLSMRTIVRPAPGPVNGPVSDPVSEPVVDVARVVGPLVCAVGAGVHAGLVTAHLRESTLLGVLFAVDAVLLGLAALAISDRHARTVHHAGAAAVLVGTALAYLLSRTTGLPGVTSEPEPVDVLGLLTTVSELAGAAACLLVILRRNHR